MESVGKVRLERCEVVLNVSVHRTHQGTSISPTPHRRILGWPQSGDLTCTNTALKKHVLMPILSV